MQKELYKITSKDLLDLFARLTERYQVYVPYKKGERLFFAKFDPAKEESIELGGIRQSQPFKSFIVPSREKILGFSPKEDSRPVIVAGVKACDLKSLKLQDHVFQEGDIKDPFYIKRRNSTIIIASDCSYAKETCFCLVMESAPYPKESFDVSLSQIGGLYLAEIGSEKGRALVKDYKTFFKNADAGDVRMREANRELVSRQVQGFIDKRGTPDTTLIRGAVKKNYHLLNLWQDFASTCVECGACNLVCPTCHCFLLFDEKSTAHAKRLKAWDSCLYNSFARVAGGANPRRHIYERLRNRFDKKFAFFPQNLNYYACTGCGRCIEACPGDIDIREVLKGLVKGQWNKPPHD